MQLNIRSSRLSPPTSKMVLRSVPRPKSLTTLRVCRASSRDGDIMIPLAPTLAECAFSFWIIGMTKAAVFPDPVLAMPTTSCPSSMRGTALRWIGVGTLNPFCAIALSRAAFKPIAWKPPPFLTDFPTFEFLRFEAACLAAMNASSPEPSSLPMSSIPRSAPSPVSCWTSSPPARASNMSNSVSESAGELARGAMFAIVRVWDWEAMLCTFLCLTFGCCALLCDLELFGHGPAEILAAGILIGVASTGPAMRQARPNAFCPHQTSAPRLLPFQPRDEYVTQCIYAICLRN
jgi:hypothetical protein